SELKPFAAEDTEQVVRLAVDKEAPPRTYVVAFRGNAKIDYARFPIRLKRAKDAQQAAAKSLADADESLKQVTTARDQAKQTLAAIELVVNSAVPGAKEPSAKALEAVKSALAALDTSLTAADTARKQADAAKQNADKAAAEAEKTSATQKV